MNKKELKVLQSVCDSLDWDLKIDEKYVLLSKFSPSKQDFNIEVDIENYDELLKEIEEKIENYDISEETYLWLDETGHGRNNAPYDMRDLYNDMEACLEMMKILYSGLLSAKNKESI